MLGLAQVKKLAPKIRFDMDKARCDLQTLQAVITHRYDVVQRYARTLKATLAEERVRLAKAPVMPWTAAHSSAGCTATRRICSARSGSAWKQVMQTSKVLARYMRCARSCSAVWARSTASKEQLLHQLEDWCHRAEKSGIVQLAKFSQHAAPLRLGVALSASAVSRKGLRNRRPFSFRLASA